MLRGATRAVVGNAVELQYDGASCLIGCIGAASEASNTYGNSVAQICITAWSDCESNINSS